MLRMSNTGYIEKYAIFLPYILATSFFIFQHIRILDWDFIVYILNGRYFFSDGIYFEWFRPPLVSFLLGIFFLFKTNIAEYLFIIFVSTLHLFSSFKLAKKFELNKNFYYLISLSPFLLINGLLTGTELLVLSLLQLFLAYYDKAGASVFLALSFLTRYPAIIYFPLILFKKNLKKIFIDIFLFLLVIFPWLLYNLIQKGNFFYSIIDSYALNIKFRDYMPFTFDFRVILIVGSYLTILSLLGALSRIKKFNRYDIIMVCVFLLSLFSYLNTPLKLDRYLFFILIPLAYFSTIFVYQLKQKNIVMGIILLICSFSVYFLISDYNERSNELDVYRTSLPYLDNCTLLSNTWVHMNYLGVVAAPAPWEKLVKENIDKGNRILLFYDASEPNYVKNENFLNEFPIIKKTDNFILLGNPDICNPKGKKYLYDYLSLRNQTIYMIFNETIDISNRNILL